MARDVAADVAFMINVEDTYPDKERAALRERERRMLQYDITFEPGATIPARRAQAPPDQHHRRRADGGHDRARSASIAPFATGRMSAIRSSCACRCMTACSQIVVPHERRHGLQRRHLHPVDGGLGPVPASRSRCCSCATRCGRSSALALAAESFGKGRTVPRFQALWRHRSAPRRAGLHHHARAHRAPCAAAHRDAGRRQP